MENVELTIREQILLDAVNDLFQRMQGDPLKTADLVAAEPEFGALANAMDELLGCAGSNEAVITDMSKLREPLLDAIIAKANTAALKRAMVVAMFNAFGETLARKTAGGQAMETVQKLVEQLLGGTLPGDEESGTTTRV